MASRKGKWALLTDEQRREKKAMALERMAMGTPAPKLAKELGVATASVYGWKRLAAEKAARQPAPVTNGNGYAPSNAAAQPTTEEMATKAMQALTVSFELLALAAVKKAMREVFGGKQ